MMRDCPLVLCLTNTVAANFTANCLLAIGAKPAMVEEPFETAELAAVADAILVNLGTVTERQTEAMRAAVKVANERGIPWVLDPVGAQHLSYRRELAIELREREPALIRGNASEITVLKGSVPNLARQTVLLETGVVDRIADNSVVVEVSGGVPMLQTVTATGCAQGGICAAFLGRGQSPRDAAVSASRLMKRAGEVAGERAKAPGSFLVALVDALWELSHD